MFFRFFCNSFGRQFKYGSIDGHAKIVRVLTGKPEMLERRHRREQVVIGAYADENQRESNNEP